MFKSFGAAGADERRGSCKRGAQTACCFIKRHLSRGDTLQCNLTRSAHGQDAAYSADGDLVDRPQIESIRDPHAPCVRDINNGLPA